MEHTYPLPLNRLAEVYVDFSSRSVTADQVLAAVAAVDQHGEVIETDKEKRNDAIEALAIEVGMHVLACLISHGLLHVGKVGWKTFWSRPKNEIVKETEVNVNAKTEPFIDKAIPFLRDSDPDKLVKGWQGEMKK